MNAPAAPAAVVGLTAELVPCDTICPSDTHIQQLRRKRFDQTELLELATNITATNGVLQPILVRPFPAVRADIVKNGKGIAPKYELVAGERRWLATQRAGFVHIAAVIREIDDGDVLLAQMSENKQRNDYTPLEESAGYQDLQEIKKWDAQQIADHIGKSKSYVYARMKLAALGDAARQALTAGKIDYSKALLLARFAPALQAKALEALTREDYNDEPISYRQAFTDVREHLMKDLGRAPFDRADATYTATVTVKAKGSKAEDRTETLPACEGCTHNSAHDIELSRDLHDAHVCTNGECYELKVVAFHTRHRQELEAAGTKILTGEAAKKIFPRKDKIVGHVDLDEQCYEDSLPEEPPQQRKGESDQDFERRENAYYERENSYESRTFRQLLAAAKQPLAVVLVEDPKTGRVRELVPAKPARELLQKQHKINLPAWKSAPLPPRPTGGGSNTSAHDWKEQQRKQEERREHEREYRLAVGKAVFEKCGGALTHQDLVDVADVLLDDIGRGAELLYGTKTPPEPAKLKDAELAKLIRVALFAGEVYDTWGAPTALLAAAKRHKVDAAKIKTDLEKQRRETEKAKKAKKAAAPAEAKTPAPATPKKAAKKKPAAKK